MQFPGKIISFNAAIKTLPFIFCIISGPGSYDAKLDYMLKKPPIFSMASRYNIPSDTNMKPGPGAHRPEKLNLGHVPAYSFGIKHSEYLGHFREASTALC